jgi:DNA-binding NarL/FixJ family response regulator
MTEVHHIILADNYTILRNELKSILENSGDFQVAGEAGHGLEVLHLLARGIVPDVLVLDLMMPKMSGIDVLTEIRRMDYDFPVLVLTMHKEPEFLCRSFLAGANGYMLKDEIAKEWITALHAVLDQNIYLSPAMKKDLPKTCRILSRAGQPLPSNFEHCKKSPFFG